MELQNQKELKKDLELCKKRFKNSFYLAIPTFSLWPLGFLYPKIHPLIIFLSALALWLTCSYIAFMHFLSAKKKLEQHKK